MDGSEKEFEDTCPVCFDSFKKEVTTQCGHRFCKQCLGRAKKRLPSCPVCRSQLVSYSRNMYLFDKLQ